MAVLVFLGAMSFAPQMHPITRIPVFMMQAYACLIALSGLHAIAKTRTPAALVFVPPLMIMHHAAHVFGYMIGSIKPIRFRR